MLYIKVFTIYLMLLFTTVIAHAQPISPSKDLVSKSNVKDINKLDLPYKVKDLGDDEDLFTEDELTEDPGEDDLNKRKIDWSQIPYIPSKYPVLKPAPDPEF